MSISSAVILGVVQGLTEFLPISSSAHLIIFGKLLNLGIQPLIFDTTLHLASGMALLIVFYREIKNFFPSFVKDCIRKKGKFKEFSGEGRLAVFIGVGSIPAVIVGFWGKSYIENNFRNVYWVLIFLILGTVLMTLAESFSIFTLLYKIVPFLGKIWALFFGKVEKTLSIFSSFLVGIFQAFALFPGVSRSASTISAGMFLGLPRERAVRFSFLLSIPVVVGASIYEIFSSSENLTGVFAFEALIVGFFTSFVFSLLAIKFMLRFLKNNSLYIFILYRVLLILYISYFATSLI